MPDFKIDETLCVVCKMAHDVLTGTMDADVAIVVAYVVGAQGHGLTICQKHMSNVKQQVQVPKGTEH